MNSGYKQTLRTTGMLSVAILLAGMTAAAQAQKPDETKPEQVENNAPGFYVRADVDRTDRVYREGEPLVISGISERDAYFYVLYKQADGKTFQVYPNSKQPNNFVKANPQVNIPASDDQFRWRVGPPFGKEMILLVASLDKINELESPELREEIFNDVNEVRLQRTTKSMKSIDPKKIAIDFVEIETKSKTEPVIAPQARRFGVFFGVKNYLFADEYNTFLKEAVAAGKADRFQGLDMEYAENNVEVVSSMFKSMGKLDDSKTFLSKAATKANLKYAITEWLPKVSRPGDTVFIYWSSHGSTMDDDDGDEADKIEEWLCVADQCTLPIYQQLEKKKAAGTLEPEKEKLFAEYKQIVDRAGGNAAAANDALIRHTAVTDDLFGHWIQSLAGRQVV
jgi:hypothetical protein